MDATELEAPAPHDGLAAFTSRIMAIDLAFFRFIGGLALPRFVSWPLVLFVRIGDGWLWGAIALSLWYALPVPELKRVVLHCILAIAVSLVIYFPIKFSMRRLRPYDSGLDVSPLVPPLDKYSFPSGHTMNNLAVALTLALSFPRLTVPALVFPLVLGTLRVLFGVHYLSDIVGGGVLGILAFWVAKAIFPAIPF